MNPMKRTWIALAAAAAFAMLAGAGCDNDDSSSNPLEAAGLSASEAAGAGIGLGPLAGLTVEDLDERANLTDEQALKMEQILSRIQAERRALREGRRGRQGDPGDGPGGRFGGQRGAEPPMVAFLEEASQVLSPDQFKELALLIGERRDQAAEIHPGRGPGWGKGGPRGDGAGRDFQRMGEQAAKRLGLTEEQMDTVRPILQARGEDIREIREQVRSGALAREEARSRTQAIHEETREQIHALLTPEQLEKAESFRRERVAHRIEDRMEKLDDQLDRRAAFLDRVLGLTDEQAAQVQSLILATSADRAALMEQVKAEPMDPPRVGDAVREIETALAGKIEALLTEEQKARWEAVKGLLPGRGPRR